MRLIGWPLIPILLFGLRLLSYTPLELFHRFSVRAVLPYMLHTTMIYGKGRGELVRLLKHRQIPFDWFYEDSCKELMDSDRLKEILSLSGEDHRAQLLSLKCIESLTVSLSRRELDKLGPSFFFDHVSQHAPAYYANGRLLWDLLKSYKHPSGLVQDCSWLISPKVHDGVFRTQAFDYIDRPDAWRMFHHSCFFSSCTGNSNFDRLQVLAFWLRDEVSMGQFIFLGPCAQMKWIVHLLVILKRIEVEFADTSFYLILPLTEYLSRLLNILNLYNPKRDLISYCCRAWFRVYQIPKEPKLPRLKDILLEIRSSKDGVEENARWTLVVLELYHMVSGKDIWGKGNLVKMLCENLMLASPIEQRNWIRIYLECPERLRFLENTLIHSISRSKDLQSWIMTKSIQTDLPELRRLIFGAVPFNARLKETRARYFKAPNRFTGRLLNLYRIVSVETETNLRYMIGFEMERVILGYLAELGPYVTYDVDTGSYKVALLCPHRMSGFAFIMSTARLFSIPLGYFDLCKNQEQLIFGVVEEISVHQAVGRFDFFEQTPTSSCDMLRLSDCKIVRHQDQFPPAACRDTCSDCEVIYVEDIMVRISKAVTTSAEVFGQLIDYNELCISIKH